MPKLSEVCRYVRSKNAGPFWVTVDLFFKDDDHYARFSRDPAINADLFHTIYGASPDQVRFFHVDTLHTVKISYPRLNPQGWKGERDMHSGQQYSRLLDLELGATAA